MEPEQPQQQLPLCESHNHQHIWAAFPHRNRLQEPPQQRIPSSPLVMCCQVGSREIWGLQEAGGSVELIRAMPWIQCETGPQANLYFPGCPCRKHCPYILTHVCVGWRGAERQQGQEVRGKPGKGMASILSLPYQTHGPAAPSSCRTLWGQVGWDHVPLSIHLWVCPRGVC